LLVITLNTLSNKKKINTLTIALSFDCSVLKHPSDSLITWKHSVSFGLKDHLKAKPYWSVTLYSVMLLSWVNRNKEIPRLNE